MATVIKLYVRLNVGWVTSKRIDTLTQQQIGCCTLAEPHGFHQRGPAVLGVIILPARL